MQIDSDQWRQTVISGAQALGVAVSRDQARVMQQHALELLTWNRTTNLTAITDPKEVAVKHYVDALAAVSRIGEGDRVLDAGSGGGFPGMVFKIVRPDLSVTLVDSVRKKVSFLKFTIRNLGLTGIDAVHGRLEELGESSLYQRQFDLVVCRAFSALAHFARLTHPFLASGGSLLAMKGPRSDDSDTPAQPQDGLTRLGGQTYHMQIQRYRLPVLNDRRRLVHLTPVSSGPAC